MAIPQLHKPLPLGMLAQQKLTTCLKKSTDTRWPNSAADSYQLSLGSWVRSSARVASAVPRHAGEWLLGKPVVAEDGEPHLSNGLVGEAGKRLVRGLAWSAGIVGYLGGGAAAGAAGLPARLLGVESAAWSGCSARRVGEACTTGVDTPASLALHVGLEIARWASVLVSGGAALIGGSIGLLVGSVMSLSALRNWGNPQTRIERALVEYQGALDAVQGLREQRTTLEDAAEPAERQQRALVHQSQHLGNLLCKPEHQQDQALRQEFEQVRDATFAIQQKIGQNKADLRDIEALLPGAQTRLASAEKAVDKAERAARKLQRRVEGGAAGKVADKAA